MASKSKKISPEFQPAYDWFASNGWTPFPFQEQAWQAYLDGKQGLINAPTGSGKTYSLIMPILLDFLRSKVQGTGNKSNPKRTKLGLRAIWITPIKALAKEINGAAQRAIDGLGMDWRVAMRSGDTSSSERSKQKRNAPQILITTPESLHLLLTHKGYEDYFGQLETVVVDEWHELIGSKRGVQMELALSRLRGFLPNLKTWGISATIGNLAEATKVLMGPNFPEQEIELIRSDLKKQIEVVSVIPEEMDQFPWAGHLGIKLLAQVAPILKKSQSTLIFTNTRAQCEIWYQRLLDFDPDLAGWMAMHHGSISKDLRDWVENALHEGQLKAVVCTSSLDLGVDFRPVETIVQIGSPKGVARFMQRAGRSGHQPGAVSRIYFVPTHALELVESAALRDAIEHGQIEARIPYVRSFDVLVQYMVTLAVADGFRPGQILEEVRQTFSFESISDEEWHWCLRYICYGGDSLEAYDEFQKVEIENGVYKVNSRGIALRHRLSMGTIVSDTAMQIKYVSGKKIGTVEEWFIAQLKPGDVFWFAGRSLELVRVKELNALVRKSKRKTGRIPAWMGGRISLSSQMSDALREKLFEGRLPVIEDVELQALEPIFSLQRERSFLPGTDEFLIEYFKDREGYHLIFYPFEGRYVHEGMGSLMAYRISKLTPISFTIAMNDYGFELLSDQEIPIDQAIEEGLFSTRHLSRDIMASINSTELARRRFRDIASISGLIFKGYPGKQKRDRHLQSSSQLFFDVFSEYEPDNLLLLQAYEEVRNYQLEESRLQQALERINQQEMIICRPDRATPFAFPIMVDRLREKLSSEKLEHRIEKMKLQLIR
ncbi:MAG: ligase-associated DNA damage response DEXH box helicase [Bacteroidota bacterium]